MTQHGSRLDDPAACLWASRPSRSKFLAGVGALAAAGSALSVLAPGADAASSSLQLDKEISYYNFSQWIGPTEVPRFKKKFGVTVHQEFYGSNDELYTKLRAGGDAQYDVILCIGAYITRLIKLGLLKPLNYANIPNAKNLAPAFRSLSFDPGNVHSIPNDWGGTGIAYRTDMVSETITSWADVWRLASKYHRRITILDSPRDAIGAVQLMHGFSVNTQRRDELLKVRDSLVQIKPHLLEITTTDQRPALLRGDVAIIMDWAEEIPPAQADKKVGKYVRWVNPIEGLSSYVDMLAVPARAPHPTTAEVFINWLLEPDNYAEFVNFDTTAFTCNPTPAIDLSVRTNPIINPPAEVLKRLYFEYDVGSALPLYDRIWSEFKAA